MRLKIFPWLGQEFISLSWEGNGKGSGLKRRRVNFFARFAEQLDQFGLTLADTARTRMWVRDMECGHAGVNERADILSGKARSR